MKSVKIADFIKSSSSLSQCPPPDKPEYAFIGRSNVGKSSLINMLTDRNSLAKISSKPGKTQLINHFEIDAEWYLVDLPGYGWAKVSKTEKGKWRVMINEYLSERQNLINIFVLIDSRLKPQKIDLEFMENLATAGIAFSMVFTKADKQGKNQTASNVAFYKRVMKKTWEELPDIFITSTVSKTGKTEILSFIHDLNQTIEF